MPYQLNQPTRKWRTKKRTARGQRSLALSPEQLCCVGAICLLYCSPIRTGFDESSSSTFFGNCLAREWQYSLVSLGNLPESHDLGTLRRSVAMHPNNDEGIVGRSKPFAVLPSISRCDRTRWASLVSCRTQQQPPLTPRARARFALQARLLQHATTGAGP